MDRAIFLCGTERQDLTAEKGWAVDRLAFLNAKGAAEAYVAENWSDLNYEENIVYVLNCSTNEVTTWSVDVEMIAIATAKPIENDQ